MVDAYLARYLDHMPDYEHDREAYSEWVEWTESEEASLSEQVYTDRGKKRLTSSERVARGYSRVRSIK